MCAGSLIGRALLAGCGGNDDLPDLEASLTTTQVTTAPVTTTTEADAALEASARSRIPATTRQRGVIVTQAGVAAAAVSRWERAVGSCVGPSGESDDAGASCTRAAWDQLFDQMFSVQYELLDLMGRLERGTCREALATALDAVHGFLAGAVPTKVVWLDEQQQPPSRFDLEAIVDVARPAAARMRAAAATACRS